MVKQHTDHKLQLFVSLFSQENALKNQDLENGKRKNTILMQLLPGKDYVHAFSDTLSQYKSVLEQDLVSSTKTKKNWHKEETNILIFMVSQLYRQGRIDVEHIDLSTWQLISSFFSGRSPHDCKLKWLASCRSFSRSSSWEQSEIDLLKNILSELDYDHMRPRWNKIAKVFNQRSPRNNIIYRSSKELKRKWASSICLLQRGLWKKQEDLILFKSVKQNGKRWSLISKIMRELRTQNGVKNRFLSVIQKQTQFCMRNKEIVVTEEQMIDRIISKLCAQTKINSSCSSSPNTLNKAETSLGPISQKVQHQYRQNDVKIQASLPVIESFSSHLDTTGSNYDLAAFCFPASTYMMAPNYFWIADNYPSKSSYVFSNDMNIVRQPVPEPVYLMMLGRPTM